MEKQSFWQAYDGSVEKDDKEEIEYENKRKKNIDGRINKIAERKRREGNKETS